MKFDEQLKQNIESVERQIAEVKGRITRELTVYASSQDISRDAVDGLIMTLTNSKDKLIKFEAEKQTLQNILSYVNMKIK